MSESDTYNGWTGKGNRASAYFTWDVALWIDNEPGTYGDARELTGAHLGEYRAAGEDKRAHVVRELADELKQYVQDLPDVDAVLSRASMAADLLGAALDDVSWREIAEPYLGDADDEDGAP